MLRSAGMVLSVLLLLTLSGCGGESHEDVMVQYIENMESMNAVLADVKDPESAKKAGPQIKELGEARAELDKRANAMDKPSEEDFDAILEKHKDRLTQAQKELARQFERLLMLDPGVMSELDAAFSDLGNSSGPDWTK